MLNALIQRRLLAAALLFAGLASARAMLPKPPQPYAKLPLMPLGFLPTPTRLLFPGGAMFTVNYVDQTHLLVTYNTRGLMHRDLNDPPDDQDRLVAALLIDVPTGEVLARTEWLTHDRTRYLWPLPNGRFLLRLRGRVTVIAPLANLHTDAFHQQPLLDSPRRIGLILLSPGAELMVIESIPPPPVPTLTPKSGQKSADDEPPPTDVGISFYRLEPSAAGPATPAPLDRPRFAGGGRFHSLVDIPVTSEGYLDATKEAPGKNSTGGFLFDFYTHAGAKRELAGFDSSCAPSATWVSRSEFIAFGCRGSADRPLLGAFNLKGEPLWVQALANGTRTTYIALAPAAGRYGLSRLVFASGLVNPALDEINVSNIDSQQITVTQTWNGLDLLKLQTTPIHGNGQNFDLSPDGMSLVLLRDDTLEFYKLPPLNAKDQTEVADAIAQYPARDNNLVTLRRTGPATPAELAAEKAAAAAKAANPAAFQVPAKTDGGDPLSTLQIVSDPGAAPAQPPPSEASPQIQGDVPRRKPPTLYNPGESPQSAK